MGNGVQLSSLGLRVSPVGEILSFAWPKESTQRKGHPWCVGLRLPCDARRPRRGWNSPWRAAQNAAHCGARTPSPFSPRPAALLGDTQGAFLHALVLGEESALRVKGSGGCSPSALPIWRVRAGAKSGTRTAAMWGRLFFGSFLLAKQKKGTRPQAKREAVVWPQKINSLKRPI
jgi:hypothetical protein